MNLGTSSRTADCPEGDEDKAYIYTANRIVARAGLLLLLAVVRNVSFEVEQPNSTKLFMMPYMDYIQRLCGVLGLKFFNEF